MEIFNAVVEGVLVGRESGDCLFVKFSGDFKESVKGIMVWGSGVIFDQFDKENSGCFFYDGLVMVIDYINVIGETCILKSSRLFGAILQLFWFNLF